MLIVHKRCSVDLHTHSIISHDGGITAEQYETALNSGVLDCVAITDHNDIGFAKVMQQKLGDKIIVGEEITTTVGEVIGLFLHDTIPGGLSLEETIASIKHQKGLVYIPHPFEIFRKGLQRRSLELILHDVDIFEVFNGRGVMRGKAKEAHRFAELAKLPTAASSDAHSVQGLGKTFSTIEDIPTAITLKQLLEKGMLNKQYAPFYTLLFPAINRLKNRLDLTNYR